MKKNYLLSKKSTFFIVSFFIFTCSQFATGQDGSLDVGFNPQPGFNQDVFATAVQSDGKILVGGNFTTDNGMVGFRIARLNIDGSQDTSFSTGTGFGNDVRSLTIQPDGKIIVVGEFSLFNGTTRTRIARLNVDGSLDTTFNAGAVFDSYVLQVLLQPDGKIIVIGTFTGSSRNRIARLNANGSLDTTFNTGTGFNEIVYVVSLQNDGKIVVGGNFSTFNGVARAKIARLNSDGTLDTTFISGTGFNNYVFSVSMQPDNKIVVGGWFNAYNGTSRRYIARLNFDGSLDTTFNPGTGFNSNVYCTKIQDNGKIIVGGDYTSFNGTTRNNIARLNTDGTLDTTFNVGTGFNSTVRCLTMQPNGKIIAGGAFTLFNGITRTRIARLNNTNLGINENELTSYEYYPNPTKNNLVIKSTTAMEAITISNMMGQDLKKIIVNSNAVNLNLEGFAAAIYFIKVYSNGATKTLRIVKE